MLGKRAHILQAYDYVYINVFEFVVIFSLLLLHSKKGFHRQNQYYKEKKTHVCSTRTWWNVHVIKTYAFVYVRKKTETSNLTNRFVFFLQKKKEYNVLRLSSTEKSCIQSVSQYWRYDECYNYLILLNNVLKFFFLIVLLLRFVIIVIFNYKKKIFKCRKEQK